MERCELGVTDDGLRISGTTLFRDEAGPVEIRYSVAVDERWRTRIVGVHVRTEAENRSVALRCDGAGNWEVGGHPISELEGAIDVDLAWTPATNTIPIRRHRLAVGESADTRVVFVPFPGREVTAKQQSYERLAERRYRYTSGSFSADLTVDEHGLVTAYPGLWTTVTGES